MSRFVLYDFVTNSNTPQRCDDLYNHRITVLGNKDTGKTSLILRLLNDGMHDVNNQLNEHIEDVYNRRVLLSNVIEHIDSEKFSLLKENLKQNKKSNYVSVHILNSSFSIEDNEEHGIDSNNGGFSTELEKISLLQIEQSDAFFLCFNPDNGQSLIDLKSYYFKILQVYNYDANEVPPIFFICNKSDLNYTFSIDEIQTTWFDDINVLFVKNENFFELSAKIDYYITYKNLLLTTLVTIEEFKFKKRLVFDEKGHINVKENVIPPELPEVTKQVENNEKEGNDELSMTITTTTTISSTRKKNPSEPIKRETNKTKKISNTHLNESQENTQCCVIC